MFYVLFPNRMSFRLTPFPSKVVVKKSPLKMFITPMTFAICSPVYNYATKKQSFHFSFFLFSFLHIINRNIVRFDSIWKINLYNSITDDIKID